MSKIAILFCPALLTTLLASPLAAAPEPQGRLVLSTVALPPLGSTSAGPGFLEQVAREAFRRIGHEIVVDTLPGERALINADAGLGDGDLMRAPGFELHYPNLVQVPEKMDDMDFVAYTANPDIKGPITWKSLEHYAVGYTTGWKIYDRNVQARDISKTRTIDDLFPLLALKRVDLVLIDRWQGLYAARRHGGNIWIIEPPITTSPMFMYLNKKHAALAPKLARALADMKADGSYRKIHDATLKPLLRDLTHPR